eukprot:3932721-Rhodomonas_salina.1
MSTVCRGYCGLCGEEVRASKNRFAGDMDVHATCPAAEPSLLSALPKNLRIDFCSACGEEFAGGCRLARKAGYVHECCLKKVETRKRRREDDEEEPESESGSEAGEPGAGESKQEKGGEEKVDAGEQEKGGEEKVDAGDGFSVSFHDSIVDILLAMIKMEAKAKEEKKKLLGMKEEFHRLCHCEV